MPYKDREKQLQYMREYSRSKSGRPHKIINSRKRDLSDSILLEVMKDKPKPKPKPKPLNEIVTTMKLDPEIMKILNKTLRGKISYREYIRLLTRIF